MLLPGPESQGSLYGLPLLLSPSPHSAMCHFSGLLTLLVFPFCHRVLADYGPPIAAARPVICHGPLYHRSMSDVIVLWIEPSSCCCQVQV
ncbi:unnamed protein product [Staurois parvus]|uniref:Uncharacterized protein n=1 Tax=Staurois parvus TaxID=386267 RepID=A0ABN9CD62_9NEOB|nr:unnamed protein product [Staurois parvus]